MSTKTSAEYTTPVPSGHVHVPDTLFLENMLTINNNICEKLKNYNNSSNI